MKSESETKEKHEMFLFFVIFFSLTTPGGLVKLACAYRENLMPGDIDVI